MPSTMLSSGIGGSYVPTAVEVFHDEISEDSAKVSFENVTRPFAPKRPAPPSAPPPSEVAYKAREKHALGKLGKKSRAPWLNVSGGGST